MLVPKKLLLGIQEGSCNLKCPKCYTHGENIISTNVRPKGLMDFQSFIKILDEVEKFKPRIGPQTWDEPFLNKNIFEYLAAIKSRKLEVTIDTNGLLLKSEDLSRLIELEIDSVFISVDAFYDETYKKVRGVNQLENLKNIIHQFVELRGSKKYPRIGVSYVVEADNEKEVDQFVSYWSAVVDVVRVNQKFMSERTLSDSPKSKRTACWSLEDTLMIHYNGEASLCCVDTHYENKIGNVFIDGVLGVWNGTYFGKARDDHNKGDFDTISICKKCDLWSHSEPQNTKTEDLLISKTLTHSYYNRLDRLDNVTKNNRFI